MLHFITHDTGRYLECYGADIQTPNINNLAQQGSMFTNYFCSAPQCSP
ncbi:MAG TPA: sulfatase-like hydrolase/transferase, partial [bacterium]|nr:sulfatase-like hydrolase/transferase [bacterium]